MASNTRAVRAQSFMRQCRQSAPLAVPRSSCSYRHRRPFTSSQAAATAATAAPPSPPSSPYSPSSFNRPLRSPLNTPPQFSTPGSGSSSSSGGGGGGNNSTNSGSSNVDHLPRPGLNSRPQPSSERPIALPASWTRSRDGPTSRGKDGAASVAPPANAKFTFTNWVRHSLGLPVIAPPIKPLPVHLLQNPYRARKQWPPDFHKLHPKQQFHFEKTFRRRAMLKWARPNWNKWIRRLQRSMLLTAMLYFVFIAEPDGGTPFDGFRVWFFGKLKNLGADGAAGVLSQEAVQEAARLEEQAKADRDRRLAEKRAREQQASASGASPLWGAGK